MATTDALIISPKGLDHIALLKQCNFDSFTLNRSTKTHGQFAKSKGSILVVETAKAIIIYADLAQSYFSELEPSKVELSFHNQYKEHKILAFLNQTTSNSYLFNYIENGVRVRVKSGTSESAVFIDIGNELPEETRFYEKKNSDKGTLFVKDGVEYSHDQVGASQGELIAERLLGYPYYEMGADVQLFEYVSSKVEDKIFVPPQIYLNRFKGLMDHLFQQPYYNSLLEGQMNKVIVPLLKNNGFPYDEDNLAFTKVNSTITQRIKLDANNSNGSHISGLSLYVVSSNSVLAEQLVDFFGTKQWNPRNPKLKITDDFTLMTNILDHRVIEPGTPLIPFNYEMLGVVLEVYMEKRLLPMTNFYMEEVNFFYGIANPVISIAALLLNGYEKLGFKKMKKLLSKINYPKHSVKDDYLIVTFEKLLKLGTKDISLADIMKMDDTEVEEPLFAFDNEPVVLGFGFEKELEEIEEEKGAILEAKSPGIDSVDKGKESWFGRIFRRLFGE